MAEINKDKGQAEFKANSTESKGQFWIEKMQGMKAQRATQVWMSSRKTRN